MISPEKKAQVLRLFFAEHWKIGTIAATVGLHHSTVKRIVSQKAQTNTPVRTSRLDPFMPFIQATLKEYPHLCSSRLFDMVKDRGYPGGPDHFRHCIAPLRPKPAVEAYHRLITLPGEQAQVDWGHFGHMIIGHARRPLMAFVIVLSFSRKVYLQFFLNAQISNFIRGHEAAFQAWQGVPRVILTDNLKSVTLDRQGDAIRYNPSMLDFSSHYRYDLRPVAIARGNQKGRVERTIRYIRDNFFAARSFQDLADLNRQALIWTDHISQRPCPGQPGLTVQEAFLMEQSHLLALPDNPYPAVETKVVHVSKTPYARFDLNDYSVPHTYVRQSLTAVATLDQVSFLEGTHTVAVHARSYDKGKTIESLAHVQALTAAKTKARLQQRQHFLVKATDLAQHFMTAAAQKGYALGSITAGLIPLLESYGLVEFEAALRESLDQAVPHHNAVRLILERRRQSRQRPPVIVMPVAKRQAPIRPHDLKTYDAI